MVPKEKYVRSKGKNRIKSIIWTFFLSIKLREVKKMTKDNPQKTNYSTRKHRRLDFVKRKL